MPKFIITVEDGKGTVESRWGTYALAPAEVGDVNDFAFKAVTRELSEDVSRVARSFGIKLRDPEPVEQEATPTYPSELKLVEPPKAPEAT